MEFIGYLAAFCTTVSFVPQVYKVFKTKSAEGISSLMYMIFCTGLILWIVYGVQINSDSLIAANVVTLILAMSVLILKFNLARKKQIKHSDGDL